MNIRDSKENVKLVGTLDYISDTSSRKVLFERPLFKIGNNDELYWANQHVSTEDNAFMPDQYPDFKNILTDFLILGEEYDEYVRIFNEEILIDKSSFEKDKFFMARVNNDLFYGSPPGIIEKVLSKNSFKKIKEMDLKYIFINFAIMHKVKSYIQKQVIPKSSKLEISEVCKHVSETRQLMDCHKEWFLKCISE